MSDTIRLEQETKVLASLKQYLEDVLSLRPLEELSPLSVSVLRTAKVVTDEIGAWAGSLSFHKGIDTAYKDLLTAMKVNCTADEVEVIEIALDSFTWVSDELEGYPFSVAPYLNGDEVFWAWDFLFMPDKQIKDGYESDGETRVGKRRVILKRFAELGIDVLGLGEARKSESGDGASPISKTDVYVGTEKEINDRIVRNLRKKGKEARK